MVFSMYFPGGSDGKESACDSGDLGLIPWSWRSHAKRIGYPLQCSRLENSMDRRAWWATVHEVPESDTPEQLTLSLDLIYLYIHTYTCAHTHTHTHTYLTLMLILMLLLYLVIRWRSDQIRSVAQSCPALCDPVNRNTPGLPVHHQLPEFTQTHVHWVSHAIQPSHPLSSPSPPAPNPSQHQSLFQWVNSSHEVAKVLRFQIVKLKEVSCLWSHLVASKF